jgi:hypothetical protein
MDEEGTDWNVRQENYWIETNLVGQLKLDLSHHRPGVPGKGGQFLEWIIFLSNHNYIIIVFLVCVWNVVI